MRKRKRKARPTRVAELERKVADLEAKLAVAIAMIPNANLPTPEYRPICHAHMRIC